MPDSGEGAERVFVAEHEFVRNPRLAFNAAEEDCCTCAMECDRRADGICRCLPERDDAR